MIRVQYPFYPSVVFSKARPTFSDIFGKVTDPPAVAELCGGGAGGYSLKLSPTDRLLLRINSRHGGYKNAK